MEQFIFDTRKQISIINLDLTQEHLSAAASKVEDICSKGNKILFVGTKRSASSRRSFWPSTKILESKNGTVYF